MTFLYAASLARAYGYSSCLFLPGDHMLHTVVPNTVALFACREEVGQVHCIPYHDLIVMNEERLLSTLQPVSSPTSPDGQKKRRRPSKSE